MKEWIDGRKVALDVRVISQDSCIDRAVINAVKAIEPRKSEKLCKFKNGVKTGIFWGRPQKMARPLGLIFLKGYFFCILTPDFGFPDQSRFSFLSKCSLNSD